MKDAPLFQRTHNTGLSTEQRRLLRGVSRSFDLTIRLLPPVLQTPVAIGYLLARATDTVADTTALPVAERQVLLDLMAQAIACTDTVTVTHELAHLTQAFADQQSDPHERALMLALPQCLPLLQTLGKDDRASVRQVLGHITRGQQLDMRRFGHGLQALQTEAELNEYTWLVAGCVGEFWTELCGRHLPGYACLPQEEMLRIGRAYGMGLQRLNIIRDTGADLAAGRCYWPAETLANADLSPATLAEAAQSARADTLQTLAPLYSQWLDQTQAQLTDGLRYAMALKPLRLRLASALPALIGARTVALLRHAGPWALTRRVKMPRHEIRGLMLRIALGLVSPSALDRQFQKMSDNATP
jgi:farnesyl-diphosphate farnesyltransferase